MKFNNTHNKCIEHEGKTIWHSRSVAIATQIIFRKLFKDKHGEFFLDYVLLVQRHPECGSHPNEWCLPCGFLDWDETTTEAAIREAWEEAGLDLSSLRKSASYLGGGIFDDAPWAVVSDPRIGQQNVVFQYAGIFSGWELPELSTQNAEPNEISDAKWVSIFEAQSMDLAFSHQEKIEKFLRHPQALCLRGESHELNSKHREHLESTLDLHKHEISANSYYLLRNVCMRIWGSNPIGFERLLDVLIKIAKSEYEQLALNLDKEGLISKKREYFNYLSNAGIPVEFNGHGWGELCLVVKYDIGQTNVVIGPDVIVGCMCLNEKGQITKTPEETLSVIKQNMQHDCIPWGG